MNQASYKSLFLITIPAIGAVALEPVVVMIGIALSGPYQRPEYDMIIKSLQINKLGL